MTAPSRPNYRHSGARCCATCANRRIGFFGDYVCANCADPCSKEYNVCPDCQHRPEIELDHICDDWKSEVEE